jgi:hypothetical protein
VGEEKILSQTLSEGEGLKSFSLGEGFRMRRLFGIKFGS